MRPEDASPSNSSMLARPSQTLRATAVASNSYQELEPVRGSRRRRLRTRQLPIRKSKSACPSRGPSTPRSLEVLRAHDAHVVQGVAGHDVGEAPHAEGVP